MCCIRGKNSTDKSIDELPVIEESLVAKKSAKDANKISRALLHEVQNVRVAFRKGGKSTDEDFKLR